MESEDLIPQRERGGEYLMLRLRTARGIEEWEYRRTYFMDFAPIEARLREFSDQGWAEKTPEGRWLLIMKVFMVSYQIIGDIFYVVRDIFLGEILPRVKRLQQEQKET